MRSFLLSLLMLAGAAHADDVAIGTSQTAADGTQAKRSISVIWGLDSTNGAVRAVKVDGSGNLLTSGGGGGAAQAVTVLSSASAPVNVSQVTQVTVGGFVWLSGSAYTATTHTVTSINVTSTAGYAGNKPLAFVVSVLGASTGARWAVSQSATPPAYFSITTGHYQAATTTAIAPFEMATLGGQSPFLHLYSVGTASTSVVVDIFRKE